MNTVSPWLILVPFVPFVPFVPLVAIELDVIKSMLIANDLYLSKVCGSPVSSHILGTFYCHDKSIMNYSKL